MLSDEAIAHLPDEWRNAIEATLDDRRPIPQTVDNEVTQLIRSSRSLVNMVTLKHAQHRLSDYRFAVAMDGIFDLDMLMTAYRTTPKQL